MLLRMLELCCVGTFWCTLFPLCREGSQGWSIALCSAAWAPGGCLPRPPAPRLEELPCRGSPSWHNARALLCSARIPPCQHLQCPASTVQLHSSQALRFVVALTQHICSGEVMEPSITAWLLSHPRAEMFHPAWPGLGRRVRCGVRRWAGTQAARGALPAPGCGSPELVPSRCFWLRSR